MTMRVIVDANSLISNQHSPNIVTTQLSRAENNMTFNSRLQRFNNFAAKHPTHLLFMKIF